MRRILITGASSFLGHHVMPLLGLHESFDLLAPTSSDLNLLDAPNTIKYMLENKPNVILHMAALCGGIGANNLRPADFILQNTKMISNIFDGIVASGVEYFYGLGSVCAYPKYCQVPFKEDQIWNGYPEETNAPYGIAKRHMLVMQNAYRKQFGIKGAHLIPTNLYGEHDHFDLNNSHVIPALIRKFISAKNEKKDFVEVWGDGTPTREFLYAGDCAVAITRAVFMSLDYQDPINIGVQKEISIKDLAVLIKKIIGFEGDIRFIGGMNGQPRRCVDVSLAKEIIGFKAPTNLEDGLRKTISWYKENNE